MQEVRRSHWSLHDSHYVAISMLADWIVCQEALKSSLKKAVRLSDHGTELNNHFQQRLAGAGSSREATQHGSTALQMYHSRRRVGIIINTIVMSMWYYGMSAAYDRALQVPA